MYVFKLKDIIILLYNYDLLVFLYTIYRIDLHLIHLNFPSFKTVECFQWQIQ